QMKMKAVIQVKRYLFDEDVDKLTEEVNHPFFTGASYTFLKIEINGLHIDYNRSFDIVENSLLMFNGPSHYMWFEDNINCVGLVINNIFLEENQIDIEQFLTRWKKELDDK